MSDYYYLTPGFIRELHDRAIKDYGGVYGENEPGSIDYMAEKPSIKLYGQEQYPNIYLKAACYLEGFATHQYFADGDKRSGALCCVVFLNMNDYDLMIDDEELELFKITKRVADTSLPSDEKWELNDVAEWLKNNCIETYPYL